MSKQKLLITGSCGFSMSYFIRFIMKHYGRNFDVVSLDRVSNGSVLNHIYINKNHEFYIADITDEHMMDIIFEFVRPDIVLHAAAYTSVDESLKDPNNYVLNNVYGTQVLINAATKWKTKRFIYTSTDEVMGELKSEAEPAWTETSLPNPRNPYSASKMAAEHLLQAASNSFGLNYNITRCSNIYGPRQTPNKLIPRTIKSILDGNKIPIYGKGNQIRSWIYVEDACSALIAIINNGKPNEIYNISANQEYSNVEVAQMVCNAMGKGHELIECIADPRGNGHDFRYALDASKLKLLGWAPKFKFKEGLALTTDWFKTNQFIFN